MELGAFYVPASERFAATVLASVVRCATLLRQLKVQLTYRHEQVFERVMRKLEVEREY